MTLRNLLGVIRRDSLSLITNMTGLSLGLAATILLTVFIQFELSFDKHFTHSDRIFRLNSIWIDNGEAEEMPINLRQAYTEIPEKVAGIESAIQIYRGFNHEVIHGEDRYKDLSLLYADPDFFHLFDIKMLSGNPDLALSEPNTVVLPRKSALLIFGDDEAQGKTFTMDGTLYTVSAVVVDLPPNTHFMFDMLMPMESEPDLAGLGGLEFFSYYLLREGVDPAPVLETIASENSRMLSESFAGFEGSSFKSRLEPLEKLHLHTRASWDLSSPGSMKTIYIMLIITMAVMGLALSNFINLYILNGAKRSKEIGIRKVNGAGRKTMIRQFYLETTTVVTIAFALGVILAIVLLPPFARIMQRESFTEVTGTPALYLILAAIYLITIIISGFYPALLLSRASPIALIRGGVNPAGDKRIMLRIVSVLQICIAVSLLTILLGINTQIRFLKNYSMGYNPDHIITIYNLNQGLTDNFSAIRDMLLNINGIEELAASGHTIGRGYSGQGIIMQGDDPGQTRSIAEYRIWPGLCKLYQFNLVSGRFLEDGRTPDRNGVIMNEKAVQMLGLRPQEIVGKSVVMHTDPLEVIGVVEDFHFQSVAKEIEPLILTAYSKYIRSISIRYAEGADPQEIIQSIGHAIRNFDPDYVMVNSFASDICKNYYSSEERLRKILMYGSLLSVLIVLMGIYALVSHNIVSRTKEIGIRKVMGGSTREMMMIIYVSTLKWTLIAAALAFPLSLLYLKHWLSDYPVRIPLYWWIFAGSIFLVVMVQSLITLGQTRKTAHRNPVEALRYE